VSKWSKSRVVCLGDTTYAPTPLTRQGTSLTVTGAYILAAELSKLDDGEHPSKALEAYESVFRPHVEEMQKIPFFVPDVVHPETAWKRWLFQACVSTPSQVVAIPWLTSRFGEGNESNDDGVPLSQYPSFDEKCSE
jgi:2-polyprenyl-6-methoxyphenol hydroxylase-like FAD-dependent oxidoreductase